MLKEDFLKMVTTIGSCDDDVQRRELLSQLREEAEKDYDSLATLTETNATLLQDNEDLRSANMKLFKRVGMSKEESNDNHENLDNDTTLTYEGLFNEKGELK